MAEVLPLPNPGDVFSDVRGQDRTLRVSHHGEAGVVVVSLWAGGLCRGSFRLADSDLARLITALTPEPPEPTDRPEPGDGPKPGCGPEPDGGDGPLSEAA